MAENRLYLDNCCYNRPYDDQSQVKVYMEGEAVLTIINLSKQNNDVIIGSPALDLEIDRITDSEKREKVQTLYEQTITEKTAYEAAVYKRVRELAQNTSIRTLDRFHLSFAENAGAVILLTTDAQFEKACSKLNLRTRVMNPLKYLTEVILHEYNA